MQQIAGDPTAQLLDKGPKTMKTSCHESYYARAGLSRVPAEQTCRICFRRTAGSPGNKRACTMRQYREGAMPYGFKKTSASRRHGMRLPKHPPCPSPPSLDRAPGQERAPEKPAETKPMPTTEERKGQTGPMRAHATEFSTRTDRCIATSGERFPNCGNALRKSRQAASRKLSGERSLAIRAALSSASRKSPRRRDPRPRRACRGPCRL